MYYNTMYRNIPLVIIRSSHANSIAVSLFVDWLTLTITESEANPNYNLLMRREACLAIIRPVLSSFVDKSEKHDPTVER